MSTGSVSYLVSDNQGVRMGLASNGTSFGEESYNSYGIGSGSTDSPFGFAGSYTDITGLVYLINRYYDAQTGQFLSVDPLISQTGEVYGYAGGDPVNRDDPDGKGGASAPEPCTDSEVSVPAWKQALLCWAAYAAIDGKTGQSLLSSADKGIAYGGCESPSSSNASEPTTPLATPGFEVLTAAD